MIDDGMLSIGDLSQRTGLPVRTIRFYSDAGVVSESARSPAGYRLYNREAVIRLGLVRTLRELDVPLGTIRAVLSERTSLAQVATAHVDTLEVQIRQLRLRRAVLRALAKTEATPQEAILMHHLVSMSEPERQRLIDDFLRETFGGLDANPELVALLDSTRPELPDDPEPAQVNAWVELTDLVQDPDFRASVRRMAQYQADQRAAGDDTGLHHDLTVLVIEQVQAAIDAGIDPASPAADAVVDHLIDAYAQTFTRSDTAAYRAEVLHRLEVAADPRAQQYFHLVTQINGWPPQPDLTPVFEWFTHALRTHPPQLHRCRLDPPSQAVTPGYLTIVGRTGVWPDYDRRDLWAAVQTYVDRERRYGAVDAPKASGIGDAAPPRGADLWERLPIRSSWAYSRPNRTTTGEGSVRMGPSMGAARWDEHSAR